MAISAARGVTIVMNRCEDAKASGFLDLSECMLMYVADAIYMVLKDYEINRCSLKNNELKKFPTKFPSKFPKMTIINVEGNKLTQLPQEMATWCHLKGINLAKNHFIEFPDVLYDIKSLNLLDLSHNNIKEIDIEKILRELPLLKQINITSNPCSLGLKNKLQIFKAISDCLIKLE